MRMSDLDLLIPQPAPPQTWRSRWATVTSLEPLRVRRDGEDDPLPSTPINTVGKLELGERVLTVITDRQVVLLARAPQTAGVQKAGTLGNQNLYEKHPSGLLVCRGTYSFPSKANTAQVFNWTFPVPFISMPHISVTADTTVPQNVFTGVTDRAFESVKIRFYRTTAFVTPVTFKASGLWK